MSSGLFYPGDGMYSRMNNSVAAANDEMAARRRRNFQQEDSLRQSELEDASLGRLERQRNMAEVPRQFDVRMNVLREILNRGNQFQPMQEAPAMPGVQPQAGASLAVSGRAPVGPGQNALGGDAMRNSIARYLQSLMGRGA